MIEALFNGRVLTDEGLTDKLVVLLEGTCILDVVPPDDPRCATATRQNLHGGLLLPGFIDCQVNGGGGALFNADPSVATIGRIAKAHRQFGTTSLLPTFISDDLERVAQAIEAVRAAMNANMPGVIGIHIEGPFLNPSRKGTHDTDKFRTLDKAAIALLSSLKIGRTLVTLAPEMTTPAMIAALAATGVTIAAGHTDATCAETQTALRLGVTGFTHLFNAMSPLTSREPGVVGAALADENAWCGIINDGHHVSPLVLKLALRCKPRGRVMLVTDAMPCVGTNDGDFMLQGKTISVHDGKCVDAEGTLSGSALDMATAVRNAMSLLGLDVAEAARMASTYPAEFLGLGRELGRISPRYRANLVLTDSDLNVHETWIDGQTGASA